LRYCWSMDGTSRIFRGIKRTSKIGGGRAKLLFSGLLKGSFIAPLEIRQLRVFRYQRKLMGQVSAEKNRLQKILEDGNIKLSAVVTDSFGVRARRIIEAMLGGETEVEELVYNEPQKLERLER